MLEFRTQSWKWSRDMVKALVTRPEYNLGSLSVLSLSPGQKNTEGYRRMSIPSAFIQKKKKNPVPKDWSLNSHLVNLVLTEIQKNPSSMVYGHKAQIIWKPFPHWYSAAREDPSISMHSHHCWSWQLFDRTIGRLQFKKKGQVTGWNAAFPLLGAFSSG